MSDLETIQDILDGNIDKFSILVKKYQQKMFCTALGFVHNKEDAEEITQDAFVKAFQKLADFKREAAFATWLHRILINQSINHLKRNKIKKFFTDINILKLKNSSEPNPQEILENKTYSEIIAKAINKLSEKQKTAFVLSKYNDFSQREIASIMQTTEGAIEQLLVRAKNNLKKYLREKI